jgi:Ca2+-binding EF-hand superfamily protein
MFGGGPDAFFNRLANGKDYIDIAEARFMKAPLEEYAKNNKITDGKITKDQFTKFMDEMRTKMQNGDNIFRPGGGPGGPPGKAGAPPSKEEIEAKVKEEVDRYMERYDKNKDGFLDLEEMPNRLKDKDKWKEFDKDKDGKLNRAEVTEYLREFVQRRMKMQNNPPNNNDNNNNNNNNQPPATSVTTIDNTILDQRPVVFRAGALPTGLPDWFYKLDLDGDGQISLYEWRKGSEPLEKFEEWDRDGDGYITAEEVQFKLGVNVASAQDDDDLARPTGTAAYSAGAPGDGGPSNAGPGGFNRMNRGNKGGNRGNKGGNRFGGFGNFGGGQPGGQRPGGFGGFGGQRPGGFGQPGGFTPPGGSGQPGGGFPFGGRGGNRGGNAGNNQGEP